MPSRFCRAEPALVRIGRFRFNPEVIGREIAADPPTALGMASWKLDRTEWRKEGPRTRRAAWSKLRIGAKERIANDWVPLTPSEIKARGDFSKMGEGGAPDQSRQTSDGNGGRCWDLGERPCPELNRNQSFRKRSLYPLELQGLEGSNLWQERGMSIKPNFPRRSQEKWPFRGRFYFNRIKFFVRLLGAFALRAGS